MSTLPALTVFVKTPGLSPVKTRLAATIGRAEADRFYDLCLTVVEAVARQAADRGIVQPYWAVAEAAGAADARWQGFDRVPQGDGDLGDRLARVSKALHARHPTVLFAGSDAPTLSADRIAAAVAAVSDPATPFAIARSADGGFALFAAARVVPPEVWRGVPYSSDATAETFVHRLRPLGGVAELEPLDDVDSAADLARLAAASGPLLPSQEAVVEYARRLLPAMERVPNPGERRPAPH